MRIIKEFNHKFMKVSHVEIGIKLLKLCSFGFPFDNHWNYGKIEHENGLKF